MPKTLRDIRVISRLQESTSYISWAFFTLYVSALLFVIAIFTNNWFVYGANLKTGIWRICMFQQPIGSWKCDSIQLGFAVTVQAFSMVALLGYVCTTAFLAIYVKCSTAPTTIFPLTLSLCLLCLCIASLQMMSLVVYAIKVENVIADVTKNYSTGKRVVSWSFGIALISIAMVTISAILAFSEVRKIATNTESTDV